METILGIDLGTTNSEVAVVKENGEVYVFREDGNPILPSVVGLDDHGELLVGVAARNQYVLAPDRTIKSIKRQMGQDIKVKLGSQEFRPEEISAMILRKLKDRAEKELGYAVSKAVITVPAFFSEIQREATRQAGELAGLEVVRIINEPTAAALTYEPHPTDVERLLVYDLGGGTFDVSIVQIENGVVEVLSSHGDTQLGGDDFDQLLFDHICDRFQKEHDVDLRKSQIPKSRVLRASEEAKKQLSSEPFVQVTEEFIAEKNGTPLNLQLELARSDYEKLIMPLLTKTLTCVDQALTDSKLQVNQISKVVLVGGATRTPLVQSLLSERLSQPLHTEVNPDLGVAMGAAIQGALIAGRDVGPVLVDITPHTLGIQCLGPLYGRISTFHFSEVIPRNTALPASRTQVYTTASDEQEAAHIAVFQGEHADVRNNQMVGDFDLEGLAKVNQGNQILVRFDLDLDGILKVAAIERNTGLAQNLVIENSASLFRASNRDGKANSRLKKTFESSRHFVKTPQSAPVESTGAVLLGGTDLVDAKLSPEDRTLFQKARELVAKAQDAAQSAGTEDADELRQLATQLETALTDGNVGEVRDLSVKLEDVVFYLQDA
ncbi:MAG: molecular chaperone [Planctomycetaceae bacterium]|nr:molecular chaperone [Planctomycetaceae bacterium]